MVSRSTQSWAVGSTVKVGFVSGLMVVDAIKTERDYAPDAYVLRKGDAWYRFVPHKGLKHFETEKEARLGRQILIDW
jgi:hypothetical protein